MGGPRETHVNCWRRGVSRPILDEDFKKICLQFFGQNSQGQTSRSKFKILKMPCLDLKQAAFNKKLDF